MPPGQETKRRCDSRYYLNTHALNATGNLAVEAEFPAKMLTQFGESGDGKERCRSGLRFFLLDDRPTHVIATIWTNHMGRQGGAALRAKGQLLRLQRVMRSPAIRT